MSEKSGGGFNLFGAVCAFLTGAAIMGLVRSIFSGAFLGSLAVAVGAVAIGGAFLVVHWEWTLGAVLWVLCFLLAARREMRARAMEDHHPFTCGR